MTKKGLFITFEGSEGCGKSTQSKLLCSYLRRKGMKVLSLREPGATRISEKIRDVLLDGKNHAMAASCELLLYMAARAQIVQEEIKPALAEGKVVVCDRFLDSTLAYQGYGLGVDLGLIRTIGAYATDGITPDITILLDVPVKEGLAHRQGRQDRIEQRPLSYHDRVRRGYFSLAAREKGRIKVIKVADQKADTQALIRQHVDGYIKCHSTSYTGRKKRSRS